MARGSDFGECYIKRVSVFQNVRARLLDLHRLERVVGSVTFAGQVHIAHLVVER